MSKSRNVVVSEREAVRVCVRCGGDVRVVQIETLRGIPTGFLHWCEQCGAKWKSDNPIGLVLRTVSTIALGWLGTLLVVRTHATGTGLYIKGAVLAFCFGLALVALVGGIQGLRLRSRNPHKPT